MKTNKLQVIIIIVSIIAGIFAVLRFSCYIGCGDSGGPTKGGQLIIWGTAPATIFEPVFNEYKNQTKTEIFYTQKDPRTYEQELIETLASGKSPDIFMINQTLLSRHKDKLYPVQENTMRVKTFRNVYIDLAAKVFIAKTGAKRETTDTIFALPIWIDPLVLYWNKDLFNAKAVALPPTTWTTFSENSNKISGIDPLGKISIAGAALGRASNIPLFKEIYSLIFLQQGGNIIDGKGDLIFADSPKDANGGTLASPAASTLRFYTDFSMLGRSTYTWNGSLKEPREMFKDGKLGMMIDFASYRRVLARSAPHLRFGTSKVPQPEGTNMPTTFGDVVGFAVPKLSASPNSAWYFISWLNEPAQALQISTFAGTAPVRRDLLNNPSYLSDPEFAFMQESALQAKILNDPIPGETSRIFYDMIENVANGFKTVTQSVDEAGIKLYSQIK